MEDQGKALVQEYNELKAKYKEALEKLLKESEENKAHLAEKQELLQKLLECNKKSQEYI